MLFSQTSFCGKASGGFGEMSAVFSGYQMSARFGVVCILVGFQPESQ